jgi:hypothetical protein
MGYLNSVDAMYILAPEMFVVLLMLVVIVAKEWKVFASRNLVCGDVADNVSLNII